MTEASSALDQAMRVARSMKDSASRNDALGAVAVAHATGGQFSNALQIARSIDGPRQRAAALLSIAQTMPN